MNIQLENNIYTMEEFTENRETILDGKAYPWKKGMTGQCISIINKNIYIDGFELVNGKWKRTLAALYHKIF